MTANNAKPIDRTPAEMLSECFGDSANGLELSIDYLRVLDENGRVVTERVPDLNNDQLVELYRNMVLARGVDERMLKLQRQGRIGTFPPASGQEAAACGATLALRDNDWFVGAFRELGGRLMRGEPIENTLLYYNGFEEGNVFPGCERTLPVSVIIASQLLHAVGIAYAMRLKGEKETAVLTFVGDGGTSEGDFHEALNFASVWQVPVVFVCQNNQWAISVPRRRQTNSRTLAQKALAYDIPGIQVDGNDALAMYEATRVALERGRAGGGPTFIEAVTYRVSLHTTADDPTRYRSEEEVQEWLRRDPLLRFRKYIEARDLWSDKSEQKLAEQIKQQIDEAVKRFEAHSEFKPDVPFEHAFGTRHAVIDRQRAEFLENLKREAANG